MFGSKSRAAKAQSVAEDAWDALTSTWQSAKGHTGELVEETQDRLGSATDEAVRRASAAYDALAGRRPSTPWALVLGAVAAGVAVGWIAAAAIGRAPSLSTIDSRLDTDPADLSARG